MAHAGGSLAWTVAVVMAPLDFVAPMGALVPAPTRHQLRYHGTLAPNAAWRKLIVPKSLDEAHSEGRDPLFRHA